MFNSDDVKFYAGPNDGQRNYKEGERLLDAGMLLQCGKMVDNEALIKAVCMQTTQPGDEPHKINGTISAGGQINDFTCTCRAGLGGKCKHIIAALLYCCRAGENLDILSCTDVECAWKIKKAEKLKQFLPAPLNSHPCFSASKKRKIAQDSNDNSKQIEEMENISNEQLELNNNSMLEFQKEFLVSLPNSALAKSMRTRHAPVNVNQNKYSDFDKEQFKIIFENQHNNLLNYIDKYQVDHALLECCKKNYSDLSRDGLEICQNTRNWTKQWLSERRFRITGSTCYGLYTYGKGKNVNWAKKAKKHLTPSSFKSEAMKYGSKTEAEARGEFSKLHPELQVVETGLVISQINPWLGYSPDGLIIKNREHYAVLEIKCPEEGIKYGIDEVVQSQIGKCLVEKDGVISMNTNHKYYGQIQLGMCILNVPRAVFVLYSKKEKNLFQLEVLKNEDFLKKMLEKLKNVYFKYIIHEICLHLSQEKQENMSDNIN